KPDGVSAEHEEVALGEVDDVQHAEQQRQPRGDQGERRPDHQAIQQLQDYLVLHQALTAPRYRAANSSGPANSPGRNVPISTPRSIAYSRLQVSVIRSNEASTTSTATPSPVARASAAVISSTFAGISPSVGSSTSSSFGRSASPRASESIFC